MVLFFSCVCLVYFKLTSSPQPHHPTQALKKTEQRNAIHNTDLEHQHQVLSYGKDSGKDEDTLHCIVGLEIKVIQH